MPINDLDVFLGSSADQRLPRSIGDTVKIGNFIKGGNKECGSRMHNVNRLSSSAILVVLMGLAQRVDVLSAGHAHLCAGVHFCAHPLSDQ